MSNESLTCSNSSFIVDLPILTPNNNTLIVAETQTGGVVEIGKVSLPEALLRSGIPLTGTQVDSWVQSNSCNVAAATAWFLVNNVRTSRNNTWITNTSSFLLSATNWVALNSARLENLDFTIDNLTEGALQAGAWVAANSTTLVGLSSDILAISSDSIGAKNFTNWVATNSSTLNNTVTSLTSLLIEEALEETFHSWVISNSTAFGTMLTTLRELTSDESFVRNATQWVSSVSADVDQTVAWFKILTSVREMHEVIEMSVFAWVTGNSAEVSDILEKNSQGFVSWVSANSADHETVYSWYVENEQSIQQSFTWVQDTSNKIDLLEGSVAIALETAIDSNTWIANNADNYATIGSVSELATWIIDNSTSLNDVQEWFTTLPTTGAAIQAATDWIATNGSMVIEAAQWIDTLANTQLLNDVREEQVLSWVERNSADLNVDLTDPNATTALAWASSNSATILQAVNWVQLLTSTQEEHSSRERQVFGWVEEHSGDHVELTDPNIATWVQSNSETLADVREWYSNNELNADTINPVVGWVNNISERITQATEWVEILTEAQNLDDDREDRVVTWVTEVSSRIINATTWTEDISTTVDELNLVLPFVQSFKDTAEWYAISGDVINSAVGWVNSVTSSWVSQIQLEAVKLIFNPTKTWVTQNSSLLVDVTNYTTSVSSNIDKSITWIESNSSTHQDVVAWIESVSDSVNQISEIADNVSALDDTKTWVSDNSGMLLTRTDVNSKLVDDVVTYVTEASTSIGDVIDDVEFLKVTSEGYGLEIVQNQADINSLTISAVSALTWVQENKDIVENISETAEELSNIVSNLTPTTSWASSVSASLSAVATWVESNSTLAQINNVLDDATTWVTQNSGEIEQVANWVSILTSTQQLHDNREDDVFTWVEGNSGNLENIDGTNLVWLNQNKSTIETNLTWVSDNSGKTQESYLATRAYNAQINNLTTWLSSNSAVLKDAASWVNTTSTELDITGIQDTVDWVEANKESLINRVENLEGTLEGVPEIQQWFSATDTQLITDTVNWATGVSGDVINLTEDTQDLVETVETLSDLLDSNLGSVNSLTSWVTSNSSTIKQTTDWVQLLTSTQEQYNDREEEVLAWVEAHSSDLTIIDENLITWVETYSGDLIDVKEWYSNKTFSDSDVDETISWVKANSTDTADAVQWVKILAEAQNIHDVREESVLAWVETNSSNILSGAEISDAVTWVQDNSTTFNNIESLLGLADLDVDSINETTTLFKGTSALAEETAQWVRALSSVQNLHDSEEDQVFTWVQSNSDNVQNVVNTAEVVTWVQSNSNITTTLEELDGLKVLNVEQIISTVTLASETSALAEKTAQWVQVLSSAQKLLDSEEDQVFSWVQSNSDKVENISDTTEAVEWVQTNKDSINDIISWNGFTELDVDSVNETTTLFKDTSALAEETAQWVRVLSSAQNLHDSEEDQIFSWVQSNSDKVENISDTTEVVEWVQTNKDSINDIISWNGFAELDVDSLNETATFFKDTSALAEKTAQWVQVLSSAQNLHDSEEDQIFSWVQSNSDKVENISDTTEAVDWVQTNKDSINNIISWNGFAELDVDSINETATFFKDTSALAEETAQWVRALSSAQNLIDSEEDQVFTWVQSNSDNITTAVDSQSDVWVRANSGDLISVNNWFKTKQYTDGEISEAVLWYQENGSKAVEAVDWIQMLTEAQNLHDEREESIFTWVEGNSSRVQSISNNLEASTWVQSNSDKLSAVEAWYDENHPDTNTLNNAVNWYSTYGEKAVEAVDWIQMLTEAQDVHNAEEEQAITWVQSNSSKVQTTVNNADVATWVQSNSTDLERISTWNGFTELDVDSINETATFFKDTSALAEETAQWVRALSSAQNLIDSEEDQVFTWVQSNSDNITTAVDSQSDVWVRANSGDLISVNNWFKTKQYTDGEISEAVLWYQENGSKAVEAVDWIQMLTEAQDIRDEREEQVLSWVESNSGNVQGYTESAAAVSWVKENSNITTTLEELDGLKVLNVEQIVSTITLASETSALAEETAQWVRVLSSAQNLHDSEEDQIFSWVQSNSDKVENISDTTEAVDWIQTNKDSIDNIISWNGFIDLDIEQINETTTLFKDTSALAEETAQWVRALSSAQNLLDSEEDQVFTWVQSNSDIIKDSAETKDAVNWVQNISETLGNVVDIPDFTDFDTNHINAVATYVSDTSALTEKAVQWVQILSSAQSLHDDEEEQIFTWVQSNSEIIQGLDVNLNVNTWVQSNSDKLSAVEAWYDENHPDTNTLNNAVNWYSTYGEKAVEAVDWIQMLTEAQDVRDDRQEQIFNWVESNSGDTTQEERVDADAVSWVQSHSGDFEAVVNWSGFANLDVEQIITTTAVVDEISALAVKTSQWIQVLSSAQNLHDSEEEQVFTWVQSNSDNTQVNPNNTEVLTWIQGNSGRLDAITEWDGVEELNVKQINSAVLWYQSNSAQAAVASQWLQMLSEAQNLQDNREEAVLAWVELNSSNVAVPIDSQSDVWVKQVSGELLDAKSWIDTNSGNVIQVVSLVNETSALAEKTAQWVQILSSTQNLHESEEEQIFTWVQSNSDNVQDVTDSANAVSWVQENSNVLVDVKEWQDSEEVVSAIEWVNTNNTIVNNAVSWYQENGAKAVETAQWVEMLSEAQNLHDTREESVIAWVEGNSGKVVEVDTNVNTWVQSNSDSVESVLNWNGVTDLNVDQINTAVTWVNDTSAIATKAAEWVQILSSAVNEHDEREDSVFTWVETNSSVTKSNTTVNTWVQSHSSKLINVERWYDENHPDTTDLNSVVDWYSAYGARAAEATEWVEMLAEAQDNHEVRSSSIFAWVEDNSGSIDITTQDASNWVKNSSGSVDSVVEWVDSRRDALTSLQQWYTTRVVDEIATEGAVSWVQDFSARTAAAATWLETISSIEEGHEDFENQVHTWVSENSGINTNYTILNNWVKNNSGVAQQVDNWVTSTTADLSAFVAWWRYISSLDNEGHVDFETQVHTWVSLNSAKVDVIDTWVRDHSSGLLQAETWVECTTAFFRSLSSWAVSSSANYDSAYTWVSGTSARILSAVLWVEEYKEPLEGLYDFYYEKQDIITDVINWYETRHVIDDEAGDFVQEYKVEILDNIAWITNNKVEIANTISWANASSGKYEQSYTWVRAHSAQVQQDHIALIDLQEEVANLHKWVYDYPGPWLVNAATTVSANSGNGGALWSVDTQGGGTGNGDPCDCRWDKPEPITNPLGLLEYNQDLTGKTLKEILELILYTRNLRITVNPAGSTVCPGTTVSFYVSAGPDGPIEYTWYKNGTFIIGSGSTTAIGSEYIIPGAQSNAVGEYYAIATNGSQTLTSTRVTLALKDVIDFVKHPLTQDLTTGQTLRLSADVTGTPPVNFLWLKNNVPIPNSNVSLFTVVNATTGHSGTYKVSASNSCGSNTSDDAIVNIYAPVVITLNPQTLNTVNPNVPVTLNTAATGSQTITYKWLSGSNAQQVDVEIVGANTSSYTATNSGVYRMIACNMVNCATSTPATVAYNIPPTVTISPRLTSVKTMTRLPISAIEITGSPTPTLQWYKNNILIGGATLTHYTIASITTADEATYTLSATNIAGVASDTSVVTVISLEIARHPSGSAINPGTSWTMYSSAVGTEPIIYKWQKDGIDIVNTNSTSYLADQAGTYVLVASNAFGEKTSDPAVITINIAPKITLTPTSLTKLVDEAATFTGQLNEGTSTVTYSWFKNGVRILGADTLIYSKNALVVGDTGTYMLCATNMVGSATAESTLTVNEGLRWTTHPSSSTITFGATYTMTASAVGTAPITYRWLSGSNINNITTEISQAAEGNRTLATTASGYYISVASNIVNTITSNIATVAYNLPPKITLLPSITSVLTQTSIKFDGDLIEGTLPVTFKWLKDGVLIPGQSLVDYTKSGLLTADSGTYTLCAINLVGSVTAQSLLTVNQALSVTRHPLGSAINPGASWTMYSSAFGTEPIVYQWMRNGVVISGATDIFHSTSEAGTYVLVASNVVGPVSSNAATITINVAPIVTVTPALTSLVSETTLTLTGTINQATQPVTFQWYKNGSIITGATSLTYTKANITTADAGTYVLSATNIVGVASDSSDVTVNQALKWITHPATSAINPGQSYTMFASASGTEPITYRWLSGSASNNINTEIAAANVNNISFVTTASGYYRVIASNTLVGSITSNNALVTFNTLRITTNPQSTAVDAGTNVVFTAAAAGTAPITYRWERNGVVIANQIGTTLTLNNVQSVSAGNYVFVATNVVGSVSSAIAILTVNAAPETPKVYWGKFLNSKLIAGVSPRLLSSDATITKINNWYTSNRPTYTKYPLGKYTNGVVATKVVAGFRGISAETFTQAFSGGITEITSFAQGLTVTYPSVPESMQFTEYAAVSGAVSAPYDTGLANQWLWLFAPCSLPGTPWSVLRDANNQVINPEQPAPTVTAPLSTALFVNGVSSAYYSYQIFSSTLSAVIKFSNS